MLTWQTGITGFFAGLLISDRHLAIVVPLLGHRLTVTGGPPGRETLEIGLAPTGALVVEAAYPWRRPDEGQRAHP